MANINKEHSYKNYDITNQFRDSTKFLRVFLEAPENRDETHHARGWIRCRGRTGVCVRAGLAAMMRL